MIFWFNPAAPIPKRPGTYLRYRRAEPFSVPGANDIYCAATVTSSWGNLGKVYELNGASEISRLFGDGGTTEVLRQMFKGGAHRVYAVRIGTGGTPATYQLKDTADAPTVEISTAFPTDEPLMVTNRDSLADPLTRELVINNGTREVLAVTYPKNEAGDERAGLIAAFSGITDFTIKSLETTSAPLATAFQDAFTAGTNPTVSIGAYSDAFTLLEPINWKIMCIDTSDPSTQAVFTEYIERVFGAGKLCSGHLGLPTSMKFDTRCEKAAKYNSFRIVCVGGGWKDTDDNAIDGYLAAAYVAGASAGTPSSESIARHEIAGAAMLLEELTPSQIEKALESGLLVISSSSTGTIWVEDDNNTLIEPQGEDDEGWPTIKRVHVRYELMERIYRACEALVAKAPANDDGYSNVIQVGTMVCDEMAKEGKLDPGARLVLSTEFQPAGNMVAFDVVDVFDNDVIKRILATIGFRYARAA